MPPIRLGQQGRLGWTTWLMPRRAEARRRRPVPRRQRRQPRLRRIDQQHRTGGRSCHDRDQPRRLFGKLNPVGYRAIEGATVFCKLRGNPYVELVHWLHQILNAQDSDLHRLVKHFELDPSRLAADMTAALDRLPRGATAISDFAPQIEEAVERGWVFGTLMFGVSQVRTGHLLLGMLKTPTLRNALFAISPAMGEDQARRARRRLRQRSSAARRRPRWRATDGTGGVARRGERRHGAGADGQAGGAGRNSPST